MKSVRLLASLAVFAAMSGCMEKPQVHAAGKRDAAASRGTGSAYVAPGWKPGDQASWDEQMRVRAHSGQDEYPRIPGK